VFDPLGESANPSDPSTLSPSLADPDPVDHQGMTPLHRTCMVGNAQVAVALLDGGANIDCATPPRHHVPGFTPLMTCVIGNRAGVAKMLIERGADGTKVTVQTALGRAVQLSLVSTMC
jgi:ankyrin repeat protein